MPNFFCTVEDSVSSDLRLDRYISLNLKILSRSQIKAKNLTALVNGKPVKISRLLKAGDKLELNWAEAEEPYLVPENIPLEIIYEDKRVIVVNKPQGMVVHPGAGNWHGTLANALFYRLKNPETNQNACDYTGEGLLSGLRPGIVHRLDKDTSGVIITAKDDEALAFLSEQFKARKVRKSYAALVLGCPKETSGCIDKKITRSLRDRKTFTISDTEGRTSLTYYKLVRNFGNYSLLLLRPKTGRTHQIRVHLKYLGNPILGDSIYGRPDPRFKNATLMLHSKSLSLVLPEEKDARTFRTPLPERFFKIINSLNNSNKNKNYDNY